MAYDVLTAVNMVLALAIFSMGLVSFSRKGGGVPLYVGIGFGLFGISYALSLAGTGELLYIPLLILRGIAYALILLALYNTIKQEAPKRKAR